MSNEIENIKRVEYPYLNKPVEIYELKNGHKIIFAYKEGELVNISSWVKTGSINETDENNGISHFLEHLMFKGTTKHKAGDFDRILEARGGIINAATWKDYTFYYITIPKGINNENIDIAIKLHADMMTNAQLPENEIGPTFDPNKNDAKEKRERYVVIEEIGMRNDQPWTMTYNEANKNMYNTHPYKRDVIGTKEIIANIPQSVIMDYYKTWYTPDNITTIVVGDISADEYLELLIREFNFKNTKKAQKPVLEEIKPLEKAIEVEKKSDVTTGYCIMGFNTAKASDVKNTLLVEMVSIILGESTSSRMYQNLIENVPKSIFNCVETSQYRFRDGNTFFIEANFEPDKKDEAVKLIKEQVQILQEEGITDNELIMAKKKLKTRFAESVETVSEIGDSIGYYMTVCSGLEQAKEYVELLDKISKEDVKEAAKYYLSLNSYSLSILLPN